jgi:hypothetical protein
MLQGASQAGTAPDPVLVPAKTTWQVAGVQEMGLPPSFLTEMDTAIGELPAEPPALADAPTTLMLGLDVALPMKL